jgi:hypothetical protein
VGLYLKGTQVGDRRCLRFERGQKPGWEKTGFRLSETRLGKNRVSSVRNPVGKKPGFLVDARNQVGKKQKPGFFIDL